MKLSNLLLIFGISAAVVATAVVVPVVVLNNNNSDEDPRVTYSFENPDQLGEEMQTALDNSFDLYFEAQLNQDNHLPFLEKDYVYMSKDSALTRISSNDEVYRYNSNSGVWQRYSEGAIDVTGLKSPNPLFGEFYIYY